MERVILQQVLKEERKEMRRIMFFSSQNSLYLVRLNVEAGRSR